MKVRADTPRPISSPFDSAPSSSAPPSQDRGERSLEGVLADLHVQTLNDIHLNDDDIDAQAQLDVKKESTRGSTTTAAAAVSGTSSYSVLEDEDLGTSLASPLAACSLVATATSPSRLSTRSSARQHCISDKEEQQQVFILKLRILLELMCFLTIMLVKIRMKVKVLEMRHL